MKAGKYTFKQIFEDREVAKIVIPEIQRDYVWSNSHVTGLLNSILKKYQDYQDLKSSSLTEFFTANANEDIIQGYKEGLLRQQAVMNVGFIYAYFDPTYYGQFFLIDGQQRFTTLYLIMLNLATKANKKDIFRKIYCDRGETKLAYKVREASHIFLNNFVQFILKSDESFQADSIKEQYWYLGDYNSDKTIQSIISNYAVIEKEFNGQDTNELYEYLEGFLELWYFDTNLSKQGESLYISMNARGEQLAENENIKASLIKKENQAKDKEYWGREWERWQDFFWQHKEPNPNADKGFNEFLKCLAGFLNFKNGKIIQVDKDTFDKHGVSTKNVLDFVTLKDVKRYFGALEWILENKPALVAHYYPHPVKWIDGFLNKVWELINTESTNWFANLKDANRGTEFSRMVFLWSVLEFLANENGIDHIDKFRALRLFYVRFNNFDRSIANLPARVENLYTTGVFGIDPKFFSEEEIAKHTYYQSLGQGVTEVEAILWELEDHPYNLKGRDFEAVNISHLVDFSSYPTASELIGIKDKFFNLFPLSNSNKKKHYATLQTLLLHYGAYWLKVSPNYYENYQCDNWEHNIRGKSFKEFFKSFENQNLKDLLKEKNKNFLQGKSLEDIQDIKSIEKQVLVYAMLIDNIWNNGNRSNIAVKSWELESRFFTRESAYFCVLSKNFKSNNWINLYDQIKNQSNEEITELLSKHVGADAPLATID